MRSAKRILCCGLAATAAGLALGLTGCTAPHEKARVREPISAKRRAENVASFDYIWKTVRDKHWDATLNGVDWDAARAELRPKVASAKTDAEARAVMNELVKRLGQSHFGIIPEKMYERYTAVQSKREGGGNKAPGWSGVEARLRDGRILVTRVAEGSPAEEAGIKPGWVIEELDGHTADDLAKIAGSVALVARPETMLGLILKHRLGGYRGDVVKLALRDGAGALHHVDLKLAEAPGKLARIGELPPMPVETVVNTLSDGIGYFRLNAFLDPPRVMKVYREFLTDHASAPGIVIDMRGNLGGIILMSTGMMNYLIKKQGLRLGTMKMRDATRGTFEIPIVLNPRGTTYDGKVAVLIDELSISNAELFSAGLQDIGRARLFGSRSAGLALPSTVERLPNGDGFQFAFASYVSSSGALLEGNGVSPDEEVVDTSEGLLHGVDAPLAAAVAWIQSK